MSDMFQDAWNFSFSNIPFRIAALLIALFIFILTKLWIRKRELPPGPFPLPIIGNLLCFRTNKAIRNVLFDFNKSYGGIYTLWLAHQPIVIVADWETAKKALLVKKNDIISRPSLRSLNHFRQFVGIGLEPNNKHWEISRKIGASAIRKLTDSEKQAVLLKNCTDNMISEFTKHGGKPFDPTHDLEDLIIKFIADSAFGYENLSKDELQDIKSYYARVNDLAGNTPGDLSPILLLFYYNRELKLKYVAKAFGQLLTRKYVDNKKSFRKGEIRNFSDALITAGLDAEEEVSNAKELSNENMIKIMGALFFAGTETTTNSMKWIVLLLAKFQDAQFRMKDEIDKTIGGRMPLESDRKNCPYTWAFVAETLRFRSPGPIGVPHEANVDTELNGYKIRKGTTVLFHLDAIHSDTAVWEEPEQFKPERFLNEDGSYNQEKRQGFMPFGEGKRLCIGDKMARNSIFLIVANLLQRVDIRLDQPPDNVDLEPLDKPMVSMPKLYRVLVSRRK